MTELLIAPVARAVIVSLCPKYFFRYSLWSHWERDQLGVRVQHGGTSGIATVLEHLRESYNL